MIRPRTQAGIHRVTHSSLFEKTLFYLALAFFLVGGLLRASFADFTDFDYGIYSDHFINAVTARNITLGLHWSSSGYETYLLNPENLTVGPTVVLPVAATVALFGTKLVVSGLTIFVLNVFLLILVFFSMKNIFRDRRQFYLAAFLLTSLFVFFKSYYWYRMIGEVPAILLLLLVINLLALYLRDFHFKTLIFASIAASFAMGTKELVLLPVLILGLVITCTSYYFHKNKKWAFWLGRPLLFLSTALALPLMFFLYRHTLLQSQTEAWRSAYFAYADAIHNYYSGINTVREYLSSPAQAITIFLRVFKSTLWNGGTLLHMSFLGMRGLQYLLCIFAVFMTYVFLSRKFTATHTLFAIAALPLLLWFFCISERAMPRHLYIGLCLALIALLFYIVSIKNIFLRYALAALSLLMMILTGDQSSRLTLKSWPVKMSDHFIAVSNMENYVKQQPEKSIAWIGMIGANEFEYLSPAPNSFVNGFDLIADSIALDEPAYLDSHPQVRALIANHQYHSAFDFYVSPENSRPESVRVNFIKPVEFNWLHFKDEIARLHHANIRLDKGELCKTILYQNEYYVVEHCTTSDIQAFFDTTGGLALRPRKWRPYIMLPSERTEVF